MEWLASLLIGCGVILFGILYLQRHRKIIQRLRADSDLSEKQITFLVAQQRRRMISSTLIILIGVLIPAIHDALIRQRNAGLATVLLLAMLLLLAIVVFLAVADIISNRYLRADLSLKQAETELKRRMLENDLKYHQELKAHREAEPRRAYRNNGHAE